MLAGVIWVIGWCMILMAALVRLRPDGRHSSGAVIIGLHQPRHAVAHQSRPVGEL